MAAAGTVGVTVSVGLPGTMATEEEEVEARWMASTAGGDDARTGGDDTPLSKSLMMKFVGGGYYVFLVVASMMFLVATNSVKYGLHTNITPQEGSLKLGYLRGHAQCSYFLGKYGRLFKHSTLLFSEVDKSKSFSDSE